METLIYVMDDLTKLLKGMRERFGNKVSSAGELSEYLLREGFACSPVSPAPRFADLPTRKYVKGNLEISFQETTDFTTPENRFVMLYAKTPRGLAYLPLDDVGSFIEHFGKSAA